MVTKAKRKGFRREAPEYVLHFEDEQFDGLVVHAKSLPLREFFELQKLQLKSEEDAGAAEQIIRRMSDVIVSWNVEDDDDKPVPVSFESLISYDMTFILAIFNAWMEAVASVPNRSSGSSNAGETSLVPSIPMDVK